MVCGKEHDDLAFGDSATGDLAAVGARAYGLVMDADESLAQREQALIALLERLDADDADLRHDRADATADDEHDPEGVTLSSEWQRVDAVRAATRVELDQVRAARARVVSGTYGVCTGCGESIPVARLEAVPSATMCVACASRS